MNRTVLLLLCLLTLAGLNLAPAHVLAAPAPYKATARMTIAAPTRNQTEMVIGTLTQGGKPVANVKMTASWKYASTTSTCTAITDATGTAKCTRDISRATVGHAVKVTLKFGPNPAKPLATAITSFTPRK